MTSEESFCILFPEYTANGKPLSPYLDLFEIGYAQAENRIAELEEKVQGYDRNRDRLISMGFPTFQSCKEYAEKIKDLEWQIQEIAKDNDYYQNENEYAKSIIKSLLDNSDEYARQRAEQFLADAETGAWHKPNEKLPEDCSCVLCHLKDDGYETAYYEDKRFTFCAAAYGIEDVVAWREIPRHQEEV